MKKIKLNAVLVLFMLAMMGIVACSDTEDVTPIVPDVTEVNLKDFKFDTDQTPPDTAAVIR